MLRRSLFATNSRDKAITKPTRAVLEYVKHVARSVTLLEALSILYQCTRHRWDRTVWGTRDSVGQRFSDISECDELWDKPLGHLAPLCFYSGPPNNIQWSRGSVCQYVADALLTEIVYEGIDAVTEKIASVVAVGAP